MDWQGAPPSPSSHVVKKILRLEVPVDSYPNVCPPPTSAVSLEVHTKESWSFKLFSDTIFYSYPSSILWGAF
jgi:hypothetical protein